jgi:hypothetical protein
MVLQVQQVQLALLVLKEQQVIQEVLDRLARRVPLVLMEPRVTQDLQVQRELREQQVQQDLQVLQEQREILDLRDQLEQLEQQELQVRQDLKERLAHKVPQA